MKKGIHPEYHPKAVIRCACGNEIIVGCTVPELKVEVCSKCHPFYTGKQKFVDSAGRVERFKQKFKWTENSTKGGSENPAAKRNADAQGAVAVEKTGDR